MLKLINIKKTYNSTSILKNINLTFNDNGFYVIMGSSGCGKTTLLNILAGLDDDYQGLYLIDGKISKGHNPFAYINQKNMVLGDETIEDNLKISANLSDNNISKPRINSIVSKFFKHYINLNNKAKNLSGGEKQRLAFLGALAKTTNVYLCDEITSGLDNENAQKIINYLEEISKHSLVVLVTHDLSVVKDSYDVLIHLQDGQVVSIVGQVSKKEIIRKNLKSRVIPIKTLTKMTYHKIKTKIKRVLLCVSLLSVGFVAFGISIFISDTLKHNLSEVFASIIDKDEIIMKPKLKQSVEITNIDNGEYAEIVKKFPEYFSSYGVDYITNIDNLLDETSCKIHNGGKFLLMPNLSLNNINEFICVEDNLDNDEIELNLTSNDLKNLCLFLNLDKSDINFINKYLNDRSVMMTLEVINTLWEYQDKIGFRIKKIKEAETTSICHSNPLFNEYIFEELMRFKDIEYVNNEVPWALNKNYFIRVNDQEEFFSYAFKDNFFKKYYPIKYKNDIRFICVNGTIINENDINLEINNNCSSYNIKLSTNGSYLVLDGSMISGFSSDFLLTDNEAILSEAIELNNIVPRNKNIIYPNEILLGNITNLSGNNIDFSSDLSNVLGNIPKSEEEIVISSRLAKTLFKSDDPINKELYVGFLKDKVIEDNKTINNYATGKLKIVGVIESNRFLIYQDYHWLITYFRDYLGVDNDKLLVDAVQFSVKGEVDEVLKVLKQSDNFEFVNSSDNLSQSITNIVEITKTVLLVFSLFTLVLSLIMLVLIIYLFGKENANDFATILVLKGTVSDLNNYQLTYLITVLLSSLLSAIFTLILFFVFFHFRSIDFLTFTIKDCYTIVAKLLAFGGLLILALSIFYKFFAKKRKKIANFINFYK